MQKRDYATISSKGAKTSSNKVKQDLVTASIGGGHLKSQRSNNNNKPNFVGHYNI